MIVSVLYFPIKTNVGILNPCTDDQVHKISIMTVAKVITRFESCHFSFLENYQHSFGQPLSHRRCRPIYSMQCLRLGMRSNIWVLSSPERRCPRIEKCARLNLVGAMFFKKRVGMRVQCFSLMHTRARVRIQSVVIGFKYSIFINSQPKMRFFQFLSQLTRLSIKVYGALKVFEGLMLQNIQTVPILKWHFRPISINILC